MKRKEKIEEVGPDLIRVDEIYGLQEFKRRVGLGRHSLAGLRASGLPVRRLGKRCYIRGVDWHEFLGRAPVDKRIPCGAVPAGE